MNSYWNKTGELQSEYEKLWGLVPAFGECDPKFPALERLRQISGAYRDIFNNGGCNRKEEIWNFFRTSVDANRNYRTDAVDWDALKKIADPVVTEAIRDALREQELVSA